MAGHDPFGEVVPTTPFDAEAGHVHGATPVGASPYGGPFADGKPEMLGAEGSEPVSWPEFLDEIGF